jgi:uncharacterized integral membrane protein
MLIDELLRRALLESLNVEGSVKLNDGILALQLMVLLIVRNQRPVQVGFFHREKAVE